jgi:CRP/FNR family transcriptional regulator
VPYLSGLPARELAALARRARARSVRRGGIVFAEGEPCLGLWVVVEGRVKVFRASDEGREQVLHTDGPGATLGEVPLFDGAGYVASAAALGPARLLWIAREDIEALCRRRPEVALAIVGLLARRVRAFARLAGDLTLRPLEQRLLGFLREEGRRAGRRTSAGVELTLPGTREEIAGLLGTVREPLSRALGRLRRRGLIAVDGRRVLLGDARE